MRFFIILLLSVFSLNTFGQSIDLSPNAFMPTNGFGTVNYCLKTDGVSSYSWQTCGGGGGGSPVGPAGSVQFTTGSAFAGNANLFFDSANNTLSINKGSAADIANYVYLDVVGNTGVGQLDVMRFTGGSFTEIQMLNATSGSGNKVWRLISRDDSNGNIFQLQTLNDTYGGEQTLWSATRAGVISFPQYGMGVLSTNASGVIGASSNFVWNNGHGNGSTYTGVLNIGPNAIPGNAAPLVIWADSDANGFEFLNTAGGSAPGAVIKSYSAGYSGLQGTTSDTTSPSPIALNPQGGGIQVGSTSHSNQNLTSYAHLVYHGATAPTLSGCGPGATVAGWDMAGRITLGTGAISACVVTFGGDQAWTNAPACVAADETTTTTVRPTATTTTLTLTSSGYVAGDSVVYHCVGY